MIDNTLNISGPSKNTRINEGDGDKLVKLMESKDSPVMKTYLPLVKKCKDPNTFEQLKDMINKALDKKE